jgi:hypothetical protein
VLSETDQASTDERLWAHLVNAKIYSLGSYTAGFAASRAQLTFTRGTGAAVTNIAIGNTSDNAAVSFAGTGAVSIGGALSVTGAVTVPNTSFTYAKLQDVSATSRVLGRITAGSGVIEELTGANLATIIGTSLGANPSASIGLTAVNGSAATYLRSDAAPALSVTISPAWSGVHNWTTRQQVFGTTTANIALVSGLGDTGVSIHGVEAIRIHRVAADGFLALLRVNGSYGSPTTLVSGNSAGNISFGGYDGTTIQQSSALIFLDVTETWSGSARGGNLRFQTTTTGSTTKTDRFRIGADSTGGFAQVPDGVLAQVGLGFITDPDCGLYRIGTNNWAGAAGGNKIFDVSTTAFGITGNLSLTTAGNKHLVKEGTNASMGLATLAAGTVVVNTTVVSATSRIQLTVQALGTVAAPKAVAVTARTAGTSFTITSSDATDTSTVAWLIVEPA